MRRLSTIAEVRAERGAYSSLGLVPTMGSLHEGHLSLVRRARAECGAVLVSIFVNPSQFGPGEDLDAYPRDLAGDLERLEGAGADIVFTPAAAEIYPAGFDTRIEVGAVARPLEGAARPGHFEGVATVVAKLLNIAQPTHAYFGQKDAQQAAVIRRMARDLDLPCEIVVAPTVREKDGVAMSSRNAYLAPAERELAQALFVALTAARVRFYEGETDARALRQAALDVLALVPEIKVDYVSIADPETMAELDVAKRGAVVSLAVRIGKARLIDNLVLEVGPFFPSAADR
jgi:pantoate--beta-alanine ligase